LLQEQRFERLGGNETIQTDVRVIAATNRDLEDLVANDRFRQDLFYRLNGFVIELPPLRQRPDDVPVLVEHLIRRLGPALGKHVRSVDPEALRQLTQHPWPGNVRELQSAIKYALVQANGDVLTADCLPEDLRGDAGRSRPPDSKGRHETLNVDRYVTDLLHAGEMDLYRKVCTAVDRVALETVLRHVKGNQLQASELLGISRTTLRAKLRALGIGVEKQLLALRDQLDQ
jgi:two-component system nitrogen regulation response regulator GlnG